MNKGKMTTEDVRNPRGQLLGLAMDVPKKPERRCVWVCVCVCGGEVGCVFVISIH